MSDYLVDLVLVNFNTAHLMKEALPQVLEKTEFADYKMTVIDNASTDKSYDYITRANARFPDIMEGWKATRNLGYGGACNKGAKLGDGEYIIFMNSDILVHDKCPDWITPLIKAFRDDKKVAVVGPKLLNHQNQIMAACVWGTNAEPEMNHYWGKEDKGQFNEPEDCLTISGAVYAVRRDLFEKWGGFDPGYFLYYEETDFSYKARWEGYKIRYQPESFLIHLHQQTEQREQVLQTYVFNSKQYFEQKWQQFLQDGRCYGKVVLDED